jgi:hypothetical protein
MKHMAQNGFKALTSAWVLALLATVAWSHFMWTRQSGFRWLPPYPEFGWCADITPSGAYAVGKARSPSGDNFLRCGI